jgi:5-methylcytosine-specific restriction endonuclease McrA
MKDLSRYIQDLISKDELWKFYKSREWITLRDKILEENHHECVVCKEKGIITRYDVSKDGKRTLLKTVHHVKHVRDYPELALSRYYTDGVQRYVNLIPVCKKCHNRLHPEKRRNRDSKRQRYTNQERW